MVQIIQNRLTNRYNDLDDAITAVAQVEAKYKDYNGSPSEHINYSKDGVVAVGGTEMPMTTVAYHQMLHRLGIPASFAERIDERLLTTNIRRQMKSLSEKEWVVKTGEQDGTRYVRGIVTDRYKPLMDSEVLRKAKQHVEADNIHVDSWDITSSENALRLTGKLPLEIAPTSNVGDITKIGIAALNGTTGMTKLGINMFLYRLVCSNGMVVPHQLAGIRKTHIGKDFNQTMEEGFRAAFGSAAEVEQRWSDAYGKILKDVKASQLRKVQEMVESEIGRKATNGLFDEEKHPRSSDTVYSLLNRITEYAHQVDDPISRGRVEEAAGQLLLAA